MGTSVDFDPDDGGSIFLPNIVSTTKPSRCYNTKKTYSYKKYFWQVDR